MTNQEIQNDIDLMEKIVRDLKQEKYIKNEWIEREKREVKEEYQDKEIIEVWSNRLKEILRKEKMDLEMRQSWVKESELKIEAIENEIAGLEAELKAEAQQ